MNQSDNQSSLILYQTDDQQTRIQVRLDHETVWLTQCQMAELFQTTKQNVSLHIQNIYEERELKREATVKEYLTVQPEGGRAVERCSQQGQRPDAIPAWGKRSVAPGKWHPRG